jgi:hypothetical protein
MVQETSFAVPFLYTRLLVLSCRFHQYFLDQTSFVVHSLGSTAGCNLMDVVYLLLAINVSVHVAQFIAFGPVCSLQF